MDKVTIKNLQGESGLVNVIRYFQNNGSEYLIYSLNEIDEAGYTRLYVTKLNGVDGTYNAESLNDAEWNEIKNIVKLIVKANKEGMPVPVQDINPKKINNIILKDKKVFKLNAPLVNDLGNNKPNFEEESENPNGEQKTTFEVPNTPIFDTPVQPTFDVPMQPTFNTPVQPTFETPVQPTFETPVQPTFNVPAQPTFDTPVQPTFDTPVQPTFDTPIQPTFDAPSTPIFDNFNLNQNSQFNIGAQTPFETNQSELQKNISTQETYDDIKTKNDALQQEIEKLNKEIEQYKAIIMNIKNIIEK